MIECVAIVHLFFSRENETCIMYEYCMGFHFLYKNEYQYKYIQLHNLLFIRDNKKSAGLFCKEYVTFVW